MPYVFESDDFDNYWFYAVIKDDRVVGLLTESSTKAQPEILSIGVSPKYKKRGVAKGLLSFAVKEMTERIPDEERIFANVINKRLTTPAN